MVRDEILATLGRHPECGVREPSSLSDMALVGGLSVVPLQNAILSSLQDLPMELDSPIMPVFRRLRVEWGSDRVQAVDTPTSDVFRQDTTTFVTFDIEIDGQPDRLTRSMESDSEFP